MTQIENRKFGSVILQDQVTAFRERATHLERGSQLWDIASKVSTAALLAIGVFLLAYTQAHQVFRLAQTLGEIAAPFALHFATKLFTKRSIDLEVRAAHEKGIADSLEAVSAWQDSEIKAFAEKYGIVLKTPMTTTAVPIARFLYWQEIAATSLKHSNEAFEWHHFDQVRAQERMRGHRLIEYVTLPAILECALALEQLDHPEQTIRLESVGQSHPSPFAQRVYQGYFSEPDLYFITRYPQIGLTCTEILQAFRENDFPTLRDRLFHATDLTGVQGHRPLFEAQWNHSNLHLKTPELGRLDRSIQAYWNLMSIALFPLGIARLIGYGCRFAAKKLTLPSAWIHSNEQKQLFDIMFNAMWKDPVTEVSKPWRDNWELKEYSVHTPDGAILYAQHFHHLQNPQGGPTILLFHPNTCISTQQPYTWLMRDFLNHNSALNAVDCKPPFDIVQFDYRGTGHSLGDAQRANDLILDGDSMIQFIELGLKVPAKNIHCYGWSLGGGIAANACALHPECSGNVVLERTFSSTAHVPLALITRAFQMLFSWIPWIIRQQHWEIDTAQAAHKLQDRLFVIYHPNDPLIHPSASLYQALLAKGMTPENSLVLPEGEKEGLDHHVRPLREYRIQQKGRDQNADQIVANYLAEKSNRFFNEKDT